MRQSFKTVLNLSKKITRLSGSFSDCPETFQTFRKLYRLSGNIPDFLETLQTVQILCRLSQSFPDCPKAFQTVHKCFRLRCVTSGCLCMTALLISKSLATQSKLINNKGGIPTKMQTTQLMCKKHKFWNPERQVKWVFQEYAEVCNNGTVQLMRGLGREYGMGPRYFIFLKSHFSDFSSQFKIFLNSYSNTSFLICSREALKKENGYS